jgi:alpha-mannosidase
VNRKNKNIILQGHFIPNSHLDREWGMDFQQTRRLTVDFIDELLHIFDKIPDYKFLLDSQTIPLEDYLEIRPENRNRIIKEVMEGRLFIGPWYTAPDCNCITGESVVRNLLMGHKIAKEYGKIMKVGYTPFGFGQVSQLPQIYQGFGIDTALFYRGITDKSSPASEFIWESPDGTQVLASRFGCAARYNFYMFVWRPVIYKGKMLWDRLYDWSEGGIPFKLINKENRYDNYFLMDPKIFYDPSSVDKYFRELIEKERKHFTTPAIPLMQGMDTSMPDALEAEVLKEIQNNLKEGEEVKFSSLPEFIKELKSFLKDRKLKVLRGEMRSPLMISFFSTLAGDVISNRPRQKQLSEKAESILQRWAEPFSVLAYLTGEDYPEKYLELAWKYLLQSQPHDTIGGCGVDALEQDATYRLNQVINISNMLLHSSLGAIQKQIDTSFCKPNEIILNVFNPTLFERTEVVEAFVDVPESTGIVHLRLFDNKAKEMDLFEGRRRDTEKVIRSYTDITNALKCNEVKIQFLAESVPALGYKTFVVRNGEHVPLKKSIAKSATELENDFLNVKFNYNGTLSLLNKSTGKVFEGLHIFEDAGEAGEPWTRHAPAKDKIITSIGSPVQISIEENSHLSATIHTQYEMMIPERLEHDTTYNDTWRSELEKPLIIDSYFTLRKNCPYLEVETHLDNQHKNHRLRILFPTELKATHSCAEQAFDVVERIIDRDDNHPYRFGANPTYPLLRFVDLSDGENGLTIFSDGIREYEAIDDEKRTIALTLIRAFEIALCTVSYRWEHLPEMEGSQSLGKHIFRYAIYPYSGNWEKGEVLKQVEQFSLPLLVGQSNRTEKSSLPPQKSFIKINPADILLSGLKRAEKGKDIILRLYNPTKRKINCKIQTGFNIKKCSIITMEEKPSKENFNLKFSAQNISLSFPAKKVITLKVAI